MVKRLVRSKNEKKENAIAKLDISKSKIERTDDEIMKSIFKKLSHLSYVAYFSHPFSVNSRWTSYLKNGKFIKMDFSSIYFGQYPQWKKRMQSVEADWD